MNRHHCWKRATWRRLVVLSFLTLGVLAVACGPELDPISHLNTLRILGLRKSAPYARAGETVELELFWQDSGPGAPREVQRFIGFWCVNPAGNLFQQCLAQVPNVPPQFAFDTDRFSITLPNDMVRPVQGQPEVPPYGVAYVFYGVCAGHLSLGGQVLDGGGGLGGAAGAGTGGGIGAEEVASIPTCLDDEGNELGSKDFVVGYSAVYAYDEFRNENPILTDFRAAGKSVLIDCIDSDCVDKPFTVPDTGECPAGVLCIDACEDDGAVTCPELLLEAVVDEASAEQDDVALAAYGEDLEEAVWVSYFVDRGALSDDVRLVNDATEGWISDYSTKLFAPREKGPLGIWALVRDNRGGVAWLRVPAYVR